MTARRRLTAILAADVTGYSRLMGADEAGTLAALKTVRSDLIDGKIAEHEGRIVKQTGDGLLVEFPSVVSAVACAVAIQRGMRERNADVPQDRRIEFRIGVNLGDVIVEGDDIFGDGVNVAETDSGLSCSFGSTDDSRHDFREERTPFHRSFAFQQHERGSRAGIFQRRNHRRYHH